MRYRRDSAELRRRRIARVYDWRLKNPERARAAASRWARKNRARLRDRDFERRTHVLSSAEKELRRARLLFTRWLRANPTIAAKRRQERWRLAARARRSKNPDRVRAGHRRFYFKMRLDPARRAHKLDQHFEWKIRALPDELKEMRRAWRDLKRFMKANGLRSLIDG